MVGRNCNTHIHRPGAAWIIAVASLRPGPRTSPYRLGNDNDQLAIHNYKLCLELDYREPGELVQAAISGG